MESPYTSNGLLDEGQCQTKVAMDQRPTGLVVFRITLPELPPISTLKYDEFHSLPTPEPEGNKREN